MNIKQSSKDLLDRIGKVVYSTVQTQMSSYSIARQTVLDGIQGDIVECGVAAAGNFASMILGAIDGGIEGGSLDGRKFWGFDSFQGIQLAGKNDTEQPGIGAISHDVNVPEEQLLVSSGITSVPQQAVIDNLGSWGLWDAEKVKLVPGWIQNSLPNVLHSIKSISILRLDMDIYDPTLFALRHLYPLVSIGGTVIIDDWALVGAKKACTDYFKEIGIRPKMIDVPDSTPKYFIKKK